MFEVVNDYERVLLGDIAEPTDGAFVDGPFGSNLKSDEYVEAGVRLIQLQNIGDGYWKDDNKKYITELKFRSLARHGAIPGDIAIAKMADPVARACIIPPNHEQYVVVADCIRLRVDQARFDPRYIVRAINSSATRNEAEKKSIGSTRVRINLGTLKTVGCLVPPLQQQQAIADVLDTLDTNIRQTEAIIEKLKQVKQGLLHDLLTRGIDANGELRPPQSQAPQLYRHSLLGAIPLDWEVRSVDQVSESIVDGPFGSNLKTEHYVPLPGVRVVRLQNIGIGDYDDNERAYVSDLKARSLSRNQVLGGDVLIAALGDERNPVGRACCYPVDLPPAVNKADCFRLRPRAGVAIGSFVMRSLNGATASHQTRGFEQGVTMQRINLGNLRRVSLAIPPVAEQQLICERLDALDRTIGVTLAEVSKLREQRAGLMDDLLTGCVRVSSLLA